MKIIIFFAILFFSKGLCQDKINVLITVGDVITGSYNLGNGYLVIKKDTVNLKYEMGRFELKNLDLLKKMDANTDVTLNFRYFNPCYTNMNFFYSIELKLEFLLQDYLLIKVYNFKNYPNTFSRNNGYGREIISTLGGEALPRKKQKNRNKNLCL